MKIVRMTEPREGQGRAKDAKSPRVGIMDSVGIATRGAAGITCYPSCALILGNQITNGRGSSRISFTP